MEQVATAACRAGEEEILAWVQVAIRHAQAKTTRAERRRERRHPFPYPVKLRPVDALGNAIGEPIVVLGRHLTNHGLDFYYHQAIVHRRVVASFELGSGQSVEMLMDLAWCRFHGHGWYENGGRFLEAVPAAGSSARQRSRSPS